MDINFENLLSKKLGAETMQDLKRNHKHHYMKLFRDFEAQKRRQTFDAEADNEIRVRLPSFLIKGFIDFTDTLGEDCETKELKI